MNVVCIIKLNIMICEKKTCLSLPLDVTHTIVSSPVAAVFQVKDNCFSLCPQQSGRSWASPARRRGSKLPLHNIYIHMTQQTTTVSLRHDNTTAENNETVEAVMMTIIILILIEDIIWGRAALDRTTMNRVVVGWLVTLVAVTQPCPTPPPAEGIVYWRTVHGLKEKRMSLCKDGYSLFVL